MNAITDYRIHINKYNRWSEYEDKYIIEHAGKESRGYISEALGRSIDAVGVRAGQLGVSYRIGGRRSVNEHFFDELGWIQGWFLGLVMTDCGFKRCRYKGEGYLIKGVVFTQGGQDEYYDYDGFDYERTKIDNAKETVNRWNKAVDSTYPVSPYYDRSGIDEFLLGYQVQITNPVFANKLSEMLHLKEHIENGGLKSGHEKFADVIEGKPLAFKQGYLCGYLDGDSMNSYIEGRIGACGSHKLCIEEIAEFVYEEIGCRLAKAKSFNRRVWHIKYARKEDVRKIIEFIYPEGFDGYYCDQFKYNFWQNWLVNKYPYIQGAIMSEELTHRLKELFLQGWSFADIGREVGIHGSSVSRKLRAKARKGDSGIMSEIKKRDNV